MRRARTGSLRPVFALMTVVGVALTLLAVPPVVRRAHAAGPCDAPGTNPVACENTKTGSPESEWDLPQNRNDDTLVGFTTDISTNVGGTVHFKIQSTASAYTIAIYRLGWYGGMGARKVTTVTPVPYPQVQPACMADADTNDMDCGNWADSATWTVPTDAVSGVYIALLTRADNGSRSHIPFVVRNDSSHSALFFQTSDTTWEAYNTWGGSSLYQGPAGRAYKVSYNRPFDTRADTPGGQDFLFSNEYPMIRFLERNGYDLSYTTDVDSDRNGALIRNHKVFLSVGHDEYWSAAQRANVEAARDAGTNLAFFSGNEVFWKDRWENSYPGAGPSTAYRTLVTYKETYRDVTDPMDDQVHGSPPYVSTGTWRDPTKSPPADGGRPENGLTGQIYMVNADELPITVPAAHGKMRFWRNTTVANQTAGATATLSADTVGYESDEDLDNGSRPGGEIDLSTTTASVSQYVQDYGITVAPGTTTHHLTLYRAASGALVFGAGSIQYSWGLDSDHDGPSAPTSQPLQQATVNLFADMGAQPSTLMSGLVAATASTDHTAPTSTITAPAASASVANGSTVTVSGTASDTGGGVVGGVEVSTDNGTTWHPAVGRGTWTYSWKVTGAGPVTIKARATDDSGNIQTASPTRTVNVTCPCSLFPASAAPKTPAADDTGPLELGTRFTSDTNGWVTGVTFYKGGGNTGTHTGSLWSGTGTLLATGTFTNETAGGWQTMSFAQPVAVTAGTQYVAGYYAPAGHEAADTGYFSGAGLDTAPLHAPRDSTAAPDGLFAENKGDVFPTNSFDGTNYYVSPVFDTVEPPDTQPPTVTARTPTAGASSIPTSTAPTVTFSEPVQRATIGLTLRSSAGATVAGTVSYDTTSDTATFTPTSALASGTTYTATVAGVKDTAGNLIAAPVSWSFTTTLPVPAPGVCPCGIWNDTSTPASADSGDTQGVELGVKFTSDVGGTVTGVRFYKATANTGTHSGSLWTTSGTRLATGTFSNETTAGWQTLTFAHPVAITRNTTYVASYYTPTGHYSVDEGAFASAGVDSPPLHALANRVDGADGVYAYGTSSAFPANGTTSNYWVDVVMTIPPDTTPPTVAAETPGSGATGVPTASPVAATFSEAVQPGTVNMALSTGGATVPGTSSYDPSTSTETFAPNAPLAQATPYTVSVTGAKDIAGNAMSPVTWTFTTSGLAACPCSVFDTTSAPGAPDSADSSAVEVGVKVRADVDGWVYGLRFHKAAANTGTHVGTLWDSGGTALASATFTSETGSGWQTLTFAHPVAVTANTTYVASYTAPNGHYSATAGGLATGVDNAPLHALANGGVYANGSGFPTRTYQSSNYWVDVSYSATAPPDTTPPTVTGTSPVAGAGSVSTSVLPQAVFSEPVQPSTVAMTLSAGGPPIAASTGYDAASRTETLTPSAPLTPGTAYTVAVSGAKDTAGNPMAPTSWTFTTATGTSPGGSESIWPDTAAPTTPSSGDGAAVEVGVKIRADVGGEVTGIRFYKSAANTGTHVGTLWRSDGTKLASATFTNETAAGWQTVIFSTPVAISAGTTYVASYYASRGNYADDARFFQTGGVTTGPLTALPNGTDGPDGVYTYAPGGGFPTSSYQSANYWVDVVFTPSQA